jgi:uncharacterized repeat protein (TIGR01451 family)
MAISWVRHATRISIGTVVLAASALAPGAAFAAPTVSGPFVSINDIAVSEGDSGTTNAVFTVKLSKASGKISTVDFSTADGSARAGLDYQAKAGTVTFNKRETSKTIQVPIIGDTIDEPDETFTVVLSHASKDLTIGDGAGQATIIDDDTAAPPVAQADLAINLTDSPDPVGLGSELTYTAHVVNNGPDAATDVVVVDQLKPYVTFVSASASCAINAGKVTCSTASLAAGAAYDPQITVKVNTTGAISNTASVSSGTQDPDSSNNSDTEASQVNPTADLSVSLSHEPDPVPFGGTVTFTLGLHNDGPSPAANAAAHLQLPSGLDFGSADGSCSYDSPNRTVDCSAGNLASGGNASYAVTATTSSAGAKTVTATATSSTPDPDGTNNQATNVVNASGPQADLALVTVGAPSTVLTGEQVTYTWTITNNGPNTAADVTLDATIPEGAQFVGFGSGGMPCTYTFAPRTLHCTLASLASGASDTAGLTVTYDTTGTKTFNSVVGSTTSDPDTSNNTTTTTTTVS